MENVFVYFIRVQFIGHSPSKQVGSVTLLVHVYDPQPVSWIENTTGRKRELAVIFIKNT